MKKILILLILILFLSCTTSNDEIGPDCNCSTVVNSMTYNISDGNGGVNVYSTVYLQNDCTHYQYSTSMSGNIVIGTKICN